MNGAVYLGCRNVVSCAILPNGQTATTTTYDMEDFLKSDPTFYFATNRFRVLLRIIGILQRVLRGRDLFGNARGVSIQDHQTLLRSFLSVDKLLVRRKPKTETPVGSASGSDKSAKADERRTLTRG